MSLIQLSLKGQLCMFLYKYKNKEKRELKFITSTPKRLYQDENTLPQGCRDRNTSMQGSHDENTSMDFEQAFMDYGKVRLDSESCSNRNIDNFQENNLPLFLDIYL